MILEGSTPSPRTSSISPLLAQSKLHPNDSKDFNIPMEGLHFTAIGGVKIMYIKKIALTAYHNKVGRRAELPSTFDIVLQ